MTTIVCREKKVLKKESVDYVDLPPKFYTVQGLAGPVFNNSCYLCSCDGCLYLECDLLYRAIFL